MQAFLTSKNQIRAKMLKDYTPQIIKNNSNMNNIYQITTNKLQSAKEKSWSVPLLLDI